MNRRRREERKKCETENALFDSHGSRGTSIRGVTGKWPNENLDVSRMQE